MLFFACAAIGLGCGAVADELDWENTCDPGEPAECLQLAWHYETGYAPFPEDMDRAEALRQIAQDGLAQACLAGGHIDCEELIGTARSLNDEELTEKARLGGLARDALERQCGSGSALACMTRSQKSWHLSDLGALPEMSEDAMKAERLGWRAISRVKAEAAIVRLGPECASGDGAACIKLSVNRFLLGEDQAAGQAFVRLIQECETAEISTCKATLAALETALGPFDQGFSAPLGRFRPGTFDAACQNGFGRMCWLSGTIHQRAQYSGVQAGPAKLAPSAEALWIKGCDLGHASSCGMLGFHELETWRAREERDPEQLERATTWFSHGCDLQGAYSCHMLEHIGKV
ncbi:MAG: hypothetical protein AAGA28_01285 [Pseudomonadota bacterium]